MAESLQTDRKRCGKRRNCSLLAIFHFPAVFSKDLHCRHVKTRIVWERVKGGHAGNQDLQLGVLKPSSIFGLLSTSGKVSNYS